MVRDDKTLEAPDYLVSDLLLGRREQPIVELSPYEVGFSGDSKSEPVAVMFGLSVMNQGLSWAEDVQVGIVGWSLQETAVQLDNGRLLSYLDVRPPRYDGRYIPVLVHTPRDAKHVRPFTTAYPPDCGAFLLPRRCSWKGAAYLLPRGAPPIWWQMTYEHQADATLTNRERALRCMRLERVMATAPQVTWDRA